MVTMWLSMHNAPITYKSCSMLCCCMLSYSHCSCCMSFGLPACNHGPLELLLHTAMAFAHCFCCAMLPLHAAPNLRRYAVSAAAGFQPLYGCCFLLPLPYQGDSACCNYLYCFQLVLVLDLYIECCLAGTTSCMSQVQQTSAAVIQASVQYN